ncbi:MAG: hypothetical protein GY811_27235 [Myxococcales bacterium]|nr:hypothetical protein [Myxococcales bacterium]
MRSHQTTASATATYRQAIAFALCTLFLTGCLPRITRDNYHKHGISFRLEQEINASPDKVWDILGHQYADICQFVGLVDSSWAMTEDEIPDSPDFAVAPNAPIPGRWTDNELGKLREVLIDYSDQDRSFLFAAKGLPSRIYWASDRVTVHDVGGGKSMVSLEVNMVPGGILKLVSWRIKGKFKSGLKTFLKDLKHYAETDTISPRKAKKIAKAKKKNKKWRCPAIVPRVEETPLDSSPVSDESAQPPFVSAVTPQSEERNP